MQPKFKPPIDEKEFRERADKVKIEGARSILSSLEARREDAIKPFDEEIKFWKRVIEHKLKVSDGQTSILDEEIK